MRPSRARGPRKFKALTFAAVLVASILLAVSAAASSYGVLAVFGKTGQGPGRIGPHAPSIAVDPDGRVYVADISDGRVEAFTNDGTPAGGWGGLTGLTGVAAAPDGTIVVASAAGVQRFALDGTLLETLSPATGAGVAVGPTGTVYLADPAHGQVLVFGAFALTGLDDPRAVAVGTDGTVWVADAGDGRIHRFMGTLETGSWPAGDVQSVAVAPDGTLFVVDSAGNEVSHRGEDGSLIETLAGIEVPHGVASDCRGSAYVVDNSALRVHVFGQQGDAPPCPQPDPTPTPTPEPKRAPDPEPVIGVQARASTTAGDVTVDTGGGEHKLGNKEIIPVGSTVDATNGRVKLEFETSKGADRDKYGHFMDGEFFDGAFTIGQSKNDSLVDLKLLDEDKPVSRSSSKARIAASRKLKVWGKARGRFRTVGRNGAATVRGTEWLTEERDEGTFFAVREGVVEVLDFATGRKVVLQAGDSFLAKPACVSKRSFKIRLRTRNDIKRAVVRVNGKRVKVRLGRRVTAPVDLRGLPEGRVAVEIRLETTTGEVINGRRVYHTCRSEPLTPSRPPEL
jgi:NHL repeat-containing protein